jgi:hypothetical protein
MLNILVLYYYDGEYPVRSATADHLYCFRKYARHNCYYLNVAFRKLPRYLEKFRFDLVVFHTLFFSARWNRALFREAAERVSALRRGDAVKVALPQDEFLNTDVLNEFINDFGVDYVFSVAPESEWGKIYPDVDRRRVKFRRVLTGYLDDHTLAKISRLAASVRGRPTDVGYRAYHAPAWLGRHGLLKVRIAELFREKAPDYMLAADISTRAEDTFLGDAWYRFLLRCKYIIGAEGGASLLDRDGSIRARTDAYAREHPGAGFEEVEAACFPGLDGSLALFAISPRHLEACATRTCQVLVEGNYNGVLRAGEHYLELRRDLSNVAEVLDAMRRDDRREAVVERAWRDVVASGRYSYRSFTREVVEAALPGAAEGRASGRAGLLRRWMRLTDRLTWIIVMLHWYIIVLAKRSARRWLVSTLSEEAVSSLVRRVKRNTEA